MPATDDDVLLPFSLPSIHRKKVTAAFDGGLISSDGGVLLLAGVDKQLRLIDRLAALIPDHRDPNLITHTMADILRPRVFAIACGYPDANDLDDLRQDPAFKLACGRLPETGVELTLGECAGPAHPDAAVARHGRSVVRESSPSAQGHHLGY